MEVEEAMEVEGPAEERARETNFGFKTVTAESGTSDAMSSQTFQAREPGT